MKILVLHTTGLHLGYIGCYGCDWVATPNLDRLAAEGIVFDQHFADRPQLAQDLRQRSCLTGKSCLPTPAGDQRSADPGLPQVLEAHGIRWSLMDFSQGTENLPDLLDRWTKADERLAWLEFPSLAPPWKVAGEFLEAYFGNGNKVNEESEEEELEPREPWFDPPTGPINPDDLERLQTTYAAVVTALDAEVGRVLDYLDEQRLEDDTLVCFTASCGLALGEHGYVGEHRAWLHEEIVHVPLLMRLPGGAEAGLRLSALTQPVDLLPTLVEALGLPAVATQGNSLFPLIRGEVESVRPQAISGLSVGFSLEWAIRTPYWALLLPLSTPPEDKLRQPQLYVKPDDRWEVNDVRQHNLELAEELEKTLRAEGS